MPTDLEGGFDRLERLRLAVEDGTLGLSEAQLDWKPEPSVWSLREIVEHLVLSDEIVGRPAISVPSEPWPLRILPRAFRRALILGALRRDVVLPLPSPALEPQGRAPLPELLERWRASRQTLRGYLETAETTSLLFGHPILGPLTPAQMLDLGIAHTAYHQRQADALRLRSEDAPKG